MIFRLAPPATAGGTWNYSALYNFAGGTADGCRPLAGLTLSATGTLYGTTSGAGGEADAGTVFRLTPPATGSTDGANPQAPLLPLHSALYGTTSNGLGTHGTVFKLVAP